MLRTVATHTPRKSFFAGWEEAGAVSAEAAPAHMGSISDKAADRAAAGFRNFFDVFFIISDFFFIIIDAFRIIIIFIIFRYPHFLCFIFGACFISGMSRYFLSAIIFRQEAAKIL